MPSLTQYKAGVPGVKIALEKSLFRIGRGSDNDLCIEDDLISREHAIIELVQSAEREAIRDYVLRDVGSTNGTYVNHLQITDHVLKTGDMIRMGQSFLLFSEDAETDLSATLQLKKSFIPGLFFVSKEDKPKK